MPDAVVIGAGHNGLVAANQLVDAGWSVVVLEAQSEPGGAVRSGELTLPGFRHDLFSAFYPLAAASPILNNLDLGAYGLNWRRSPLVVAHPTADGNAAALSTDLDETAASLDSYARGDGDAWRGLYGQWERFRDPFMGALLDPFPPLRAGARLGKGLGLAGGVRFARFAMLPLRRLVEEEFSGMGAKLLLGGNAGHVDISPDAAGSGIFGWLLTSLGQQVGFPVPEGGSAELTNALVRRFESKGGELRCATPVSRVVIRRGRAVAVRTAQGDEVDARRAVVADVSAPALYHQLVGNEFLPAGLIDDLRRYQVDAATVKVDWALDGPVPWTAVACRRAATVHVADDVDELSTHSSQLATGMLPDRPYLVFGQPGLADPSRCPPGKEAGWAYTHVPLRVKGDAGGSLTGSWDHGEGEAFAERMEHRVEQLAPGFRELIRSRHVYTPPSLEAANANLVGGSINGGTGQLHQQLLFRPTPGLARSTTPFARLFLASSSAHPGGGVHGACGANAAHAALVAAGRRPRPGRFAVNRLEKKLRGY